jgi:trimeric autotransporter adhesin
VRITQNGNVGIGNTVPDTRLTIQDGGNAQLSFKNGSGVTQAYIGTSSIDGAAATDQLRIRGDAGILFSIAGFPRMTVATNGNVGIATTAGATKLDVVGTIKIADGGETCTLAANGGMIRYNSGSLHFCNGSAWQTLGVSGAGLTSLGGQTGSTQTFANGTAGTAPAFSSGSNVHTLNIPMANTASVTAGLISKTEYDTFNAKLGTGTAFTGDVSGTYNATSVDKIKGVGVSATAPTLGQVLKYGGSTWAASALELNDLKASDGTTSAVATAACSAAQTLTYNATLKRLECQAIGSLNASAITAGVLPIANGGTGAATTSQNFIFAGPASGSGAPAFRALTSADLPASASYWTSATGGINYTGGNVGIGSTAPGYALDVNGGMRATSEFVSTSVGTSQIRLVRSNYGVMLRNDGTDFYLLQTASADQYGTWTALRPFSFNLATGNVSLAGGAVSALHGGYVGLGTSVPLARLHAKGAGEAGSMIRLTDTTASGGDYTITSSAAGTLGLFGIGDAATSTYRMVISPTGNMAIGTTATDLRASGRRSLTVYDATNPASFELASGGTDADNRRLGVVSFVDNNLSGDKGSSAIVGDSAGGTAGNRGGALGFWTRADAGAMAERMRVTNTGLVGIGTITPQAGLDIKTPGNASAIIVPRDTVANRPSTGVNGMIRYASDTNVLEAYVNGAWASLATIGGTSTFTTVNAGAGSATSPSLSFSGDTNTGFYNASSNDTISVAAGGSKVFDISSAGLVSPTTGGASVLTANGTAAAPTYSFAGDADTGWYRAAADTLAASTAGIERIRIDPAGRVGINGLYASGQFSVYQTVPSDNIVGYFSSAPALTANAATNYHGTWSAINASSDANTYQGLYAAVNRVNVAAGQSGSVSQITGSTNDAYNAGTATVGSAMGLMGNIANTGTGTITSAYAGRFQVTRTAGTITNAYGVYVDAVQGTNKWSVYANDAAAPSYFAGNVGIGTTAPSNPLSVTGSGGTTAGPATLGITTSTDGLHTWASSAFAPSLSAGNGLLHLIGQGGSGNNSGYLGFRYAGGAGSSANYLTLGMYGRDNILNVTGGGNVGIGTTVPTQKLSISGGSITVGNNTAGTDVNGAMVELTNGNGDSVVSWLTVGNRWTAGLDYSDSNKWKLGYTTGTPNFDTDTRLTVAPNGRVGIGTSAPDVNLNVHSNSDAYIKINGPLANQSAISLSDSTNGQDIVLYRPENTRDFSIWTTTAGRVLNVTQAGNVGIGNSAPGYRLDVGSTVRVDNIIDTTGNFHIDSIGGNSTFINWYGGSGGLYVGNATSGGYGQVSASAFNVSSDRTLKTNIKEIDDALDRVNKLRGVRFDWIDKKMGKERQVGVIAQEVQTVFPELVSVNQQNKKLTVNYAGLVSPLIEAVKSLYTKWIGDHARIDALEKSLAEKSRELASVKAKAEKAEAEAAALKARMDRLEKLLEKK